MNLHIPHTSYHGIAAAAPRAFSAAPIDDMSPDNILDETDLNILRELSHHGRLSWRELSERVGLTLTPTLKRVHRLEEEQYIRGYVAQLDESKLIGELNVLVLVSLTNQSESAIASFEKDILVTPEVMSCFMITGDADFILRVVVPDLNAYQNFLSHKLTCIAGVKLIRSSFALKSVLNRASPLL